jgi:Flp pilus assembly protein CpaB
MRASTIFALSVAILLGLGVAVAAKLTGYFTQPTVAAEKKADIQVLVAARNLFAGDVIDPNGTRVRSLTAGELEHYQKYKDQYLPAVASAAFLRVPNKNIEADRPILRGDLEEMVKPKPLNTRLLPDMRAANLSLTKDQSAGGLIQVGEWVDVLLTSRIDGPGGHSTRTANLIPRVRVIAKRNSLWSVFAPLPERKPVEFTLEVNAYRAELLEFARTKGDLSLALLPASEQKKLEKRRDEAIKQVAFVPTPRHFMEPALSEAEDEDQRIVAVQKGELAVSEADLVRVFGLRVETTQPPSRTTEVQRMVGNKFVSSARFDYLGNPVWSGPNGTPTSPNLHAGAVNGRPTPTLVNDFQFNSPTCQTCGKNKH